MPPSHPREWKVTKRDHPGCPAEDIDKEPDWGTTRYEHYIGFKNQHGGRPGYAADDGYGDDIDVEGAWEDYQRTKQASEEGGHLVNWQDAIKSQKVRSVPRVVLQAC